MRTIFHPFDDQQVAEAIADLDLVASDQDWRQAVAGIVFSLALRALALEDKAPDAVADILNPGGDVSAARVLGLCARIQAGPPPRVGNRPSGRFQAVMAARFLETVSASTPTKADAARIFQRLFRMQYQAAWKLAERAERVGGHNFHKGRPFRRKSAL